jgi:Big-like domain-containing protein/VCBS repeat protein
LRRIAFVVMAFLLLGLKVGAFAQTFSSPPLLPTAFDPVAVAAGDFNHDGNPDLVYVDGAGQTPHTLHVLLGRGDGTFSHGQNVALPDGICVFFCAINIADVSADGLPDLIMGGGVGLTGKVAVLLSNANGTFQDPIVSILPPSTQVFPSLGGVIAVADFNGDGAADLAVGDPANSGVHILLGNKSGSFTEATILPDNTRSGDLHAVDLNHDGHIDLVALGAISSGGFNVYLGNGDGTFQFPVLHSLGPGFKGFLRDLNADGEPDILAELNPTGTLTQIIFLKGNGDGTFASSLVVGQLPAGVHVLGLGDFNGDGIPDLQVTSLTGVGIMLGQPGLIFGSIITSLSGGSPGPFQHSATQVDLNNDGHLDLVVPSDGGIVLSLGRGDGSFPSGAQVYDVGGGVTTIAVADFNSDKVPDIAVAINAALPRLLLGRADGTFVLAPDPNTTHLFGPGTLATGDFNGDGHADLSLGPITSGTSNVLFGDGHGNFSAPQAVPSSTAAIADFNGDGRSDMIDIKVSITTCDPGCPLTVLLGQTDGTFVSKVTTVIGITDAVITAIGDLNGDGIPDVVLTGDGVLQVWLGKGDGTFTQGASLGIFNFNLSVQSEGAALVDLDGDGKKDVVLTPFVNLANPFFVAPQALMVLYGKGDGTFEPPVLLPISHFYTHLIVADVNSDGQPDLILHDGVGISVILSLGNRAFEDESHYAAGTSIAGLTAVDVNGDGFPDLVVANPGGTTVAVLLNNPTGIPPGGLHPLASLSIAPEPSDFAAAFTANVIISAPNLTSPAPTGSVDFMLDGSLAATVPLASGAASFTFTNSLIPGPHQIVATYSGDSVYAMAFVNQSHTVNRQIFNTQTVLTATPSIALASQTVHLEANVSAGGATPCPPIPSNICSWGVVTFLDGSKTVRTQSADENGRAIFDTALLSPGTHTMSAVFHGLTNSVEIFPQSTSAPVTVTVSSVPTASTVSLSSGSITAGKVATISLNVSSGTGPPFGGATFFDGNIPLGTMSLHADGTASFSTASLSIGSHIISAKFNANATFSGSSSAPVTLVVTPAPAAAIPTSVALSATAHPETGTLELQVRVHAEHGPSQSSVSFLDGGLILGNAMTDASGLAVLRVPLPGSGSHAFRASFNGDSQFAPSVSPELQEVWPDSGSTFSVLMTPALVKLKGVAVEIEIAVVSSSAVHDPVQLTCLSGLPTGYSCSFEPASLSQSGVSRLSIQRSLVGRNSVLPTQPVFHTPARGLALALFGVLVLAQRRTLAALAVLCVVALGILSGCGGSVQVQKQVAVVTVQATSGSGQSQAVHSTQLILIIADQQ